MHRRRGNGDVPCATIILHKVGQAARLWPGQAGPAAESANRRAVAGPRRQRLPPIIVGIVVTLAVLVVLTDGRHREDAPRRPSRNWRKSLIVTVNDTAHLNGRVTSLMLDTVT